MTSRPSIAVSAHHPYLPLPSFSKGWFKDGHKINRVSDHIVNGNQNLTAGRHPVSLGLPLTFDRTPVPPTSCSSLRVVARRQCRPALAARAQTHSRRASTLLSWRLVSRRRWSHRLARDLVM